MSRDGHVFETCIKHDGNFFFLLLSAFERRFKSLLILLISTLLSNKKSWFTVRDPK